MHIMNRWLAAVGATAVFAATSVAQTWDLPGTTQLLSGQQYDTTGTAALVVANDQLHYLDWDIATIPPALDLGSAKQLYRYPVSWHEGATETYFATGGSPTGSPVKVTLSVDAVIYELTGANYQGLVVGLLQTYEFESGGESGELSIFAPGTTTADKVQAKQLLKVLATGEAPPTDNGTGGVPSCVEQCLNTYTTEKKNALDRYLTNVKAYCGVIGLPGGFIGGCGIGVAICGWALPPFSTAFCCVAGGIIGSGVSFGGCVYGFHEVYLSELRAAERNYHNCLRNCGVIIAEQ
jgi:hypothetical protein